MNPPSLIAGWPALMTLEMAAQYLSLDKSVFRRVATSHTIHPVTPEDSEYRWRKIDLDRLVKKLPDNLEFVARAARPKVVRLDDAAITRIAEQVAEKLQRSPAQKVPQLVSIRDAGSMLGVGRSTIYRLIESGQLSKRKIGSRTLIMRSDIDRVLSEEAAD